MIIATNMIVNTKEGMADLINNNRQTMKDLFGKEPEKMSDLFTNPSADMKSIFAKLPTFKTTATSIAWLIAQVKEVQKKTIETLKGTSIKTDAPAKIMDEMSKSRMGPPRIGQVNPTMFIGDMISFVYDPKTKAKLPYYDTFPLVFPIDLKPDGFLGINLHYLPPNYRLVLLTALYTLRNNTNMDQTTRLNISYNILRGASQFRYYQPCIKRYLSGHIRSKRLVISPDQWAMVVSLPTARFVKASEMQVWSDSINIISGIKPKRP